MGKPWAEHARRDEIVCEICPALDRPLGAFDVGTPGPESQWNEQAKCRLNQETGSPTCVHPEKVGLPEGAYTRGTPVPALDTVTAVQEVEDPNDFAAVWQAFRQGPLTGRDR